MKTVKRVIGIFLTLLVVGVIYSSCSKTEELITGNVTTNQKNYSPTFSESMIDSVFVNDTLPNRTFTVYDACKSNLGTITLNLQNQLRYTGQTTTTITIAGTSSMTFTKGVFYYFSPSGGCAGNKILKVKFASGTQTLCSTFSLTNCTWSYSAGGCTIINTYAFVSVLPPAC